MTDKAMELNAANQKLLELTSQLQVLEREYDKAIEHAANYLGYDERIEQARDDAAQSILSSITSIKSDIEAQTQLINKLASEY